MKHLIALILALQSLEANAACQYLLDGLNVKMEEYRAYRDRNRAQQDSLQASKARCDLLGSDISRNSETAAAGLSCTAQGDSASLDHAIAELGHGCEDKYRQLRELQTQLKNAFDVAHDDMKKGLSVIQDDELMQKYCAEESKVAHTMADAFGVLEGGIVQTLTNATTGEGDYSKLKVAGQQLAAQLNRGNANCDEHKGPAGQAVAQVSQTYGQGAAVAVPAGRAAASASDLTGTDKAIADEAKSNAVVSAQP